MKYYTLAVSALMAFSAVSAQAAETWAVTATAFKLYGEKNVNNIKLNWALRQDADAYKIYRDGKLLKEVRTVTFDDYALPVGKSFSYKVEAYKGGQKVAESLPQSAATFTPTGNIRTYDNLNGKYVGETKAVNKPEGFKIGGAYYKYSIERGNKGGNNGWIMTETTSKTGLANSWSKPREVSFFPGDLKFEGNAFRLNPKTKKVVFSSHYEDGNGYTAAKIFLAQITPGGNIEVGTQDRPLGHDSRDQSLFIDEDNTAYLLSATNTNSDINIYKLDPTWTKVVSLVNTICKGEHRETPAIIKKDGEYYFFSSKASGWYPSQTKYNATTDLAGQWTPSLELGNSSTWDAQFNRAEQKANTFGIWSYHWGAQREHKTEAGNFPRLSILAFNKGYASLDYYRYVDISDKEGFIPVQNGKNLTLGTPVQTKVSGANGIKGDVLTDGAQSTSSPFFKKSSNTPLGTPYMFVFDLQKPSVVKEINLATQLINGSEAAYRYTVEGSTDGQSYHMIHDARSAWGIGFQILPVTDTTLYRYLRFRVYGIVNVHKNNAANWADGIYEFTAFGK